MKLEIGVMRPHAKGRVPGAPTAAPGDRKNAALELPKGAHTLVSDSGLQDGESNFLLF